MTDLNMGDISRRLGVGVSSELLESLGIPVIQGKGRARTVAELHWPALCAAVGDWCASRVGAKTPPKPAAIVSKAEVKVISTPTAQPGSSTDLDDDDEL